MDSSSSEFASAMSQIFQILMNVSSNFLHKSSSSGVVIDESEFEFAEYICESMVSLGCTNLQCITGDTSILSHYLHLVIHLSSLHL